MLKSKIRRGYRPVKRTATNAGAVNTTNAIHRSARQIACGITSVHLNKRSHELAPGKSSPSAWIGYVRAPTFDPAAKGLSFGLELASRKRRFASVFSGVDTS